MNRVQVFFVSLSLIGAAQVSRSEIVTSYASSTESWSSALSSWSAEISSTDLINSGQSSFSSFSATTPSFGSGGMNDGQSSERSFDNNVYYPDNGTAIDFYATFDLNTSVNTYGYDITSINTFIGWCENNMQQANQIYTVEVSTIGSSDYTALTTVNYTPFSDISGLYHYSYVGVSENGTGILATRVDSIRFTFTSPGSTSFASGTVIRELDVIGTPTSVPEPAVASFAGFFVVGLLAVRRFFMM